MKPLIGWFHRHCWEEIVVKPDYDYPRLVIACYICHKQKRTLKILCTPGQDHNWRVQVHETSSGAWVNEPRRKCAWCGLEETLQ